MPELRLHGDGGRCLVELFEGSDLFMKSRNAKPGRPRKPYRTSWGEHINGLRKRGDGRWMIVETGKTFAEPDERMAVARFRQWEAINNKQKVLISTDALLEINFKYQPNGKYRLSTRTFPTQGFVSVDELWAWFREQLITRPEHVAERVGIPEIARLSDLPTPLPSPTLKGIGQLYQAKSECLRKQRRQAELFWLDFEKWMASHGVTTLRQLTTTLVAEYGDQAKAQANRKGHGDGGSAKYLKNRFMTIRGMINFARKRGEHPADVRHALDCCAVLQTPKKCSTRDPHPIRREGYLTLLDQVTEPRMKALLLVMLNLCMYPSEALALDWGELDLVKRTVVTDRSKTSVIRVGVLWHRTVQALTEIRPKRAAADAPVFLSAQGGRWSVKTVNVQYRRLRASAGLGDAVKCEDCRDGAYTAAIESGVDLLKAKLLAGHATGISDHYAKRKPTMVTDAIEAIERAYFGSTAHDEPKTGSG